MQAKLFLGRLNSKTPKIFNFFSPFRLLASLYAPDSMACGSLTGRCWCEGVLESFEPRCAANVRKQWISKKKNVEMNIRMNIKMNTKRAKKSDRSCIIKPSWMIWMIWWPAYAYSSSTVDELLESGRWNQAETQIISASSNDLKQAKDFLRFKVFTRQTVWRTHRRIKLNLSNVRTSNTTKFVYTKKTLGKTEFFSHLLHNLMRLLLKPENKSSFKVGLHFCQKSRLCISVSRDLSFSSHLIGSFQWKPYRRVLQKTLKVFYEGFARLFKRCKIFGLLQKSCKILLQPFQQPFKSFARLANPLVSESHLSIVKDW